MPGPGSESLCGRPQQFVAGGMAERVVDLLEVVEVDQDQREPVAATGVLQTLVAVLEERSTVPEPSELVGDGLAAGVGEPLDLQDAYEGPARRRAGA